MAEGGTVNTEDTKELSVNSRSLECPICLEHLRKPKSLPCLHSFCQECLSSYITKELSENVGPPTSFSCPVCRKRTYPIRQSDEIAMWAQQFPTNTLVVEILENHRLDRDPCYCTPCKIKGNKDVEAYFWCKTTKSFFCRDCKTSFHDAVHLNCDVVVLKDGKTPRLKKSAASVRCTIHKKKIGYYCEDHQLLACSICITVDHRRCDVVSTTKDYVEKIKLNSRMDDMMKSLKEGASSMETLIINFEQQCESLSKEKDVALKSITDLREKIDRCLDKMQKEITDDLMTKVKNINQNLEMSRQKCEWIKKAMQSTLESSERAINTDDHMQTISLFQKGQEEISSCKYLINKMKKSIRTFNVKHDVGSDLAMVSKNSALNIGEIVVIKGPWKFPRSTGVISPLIGRSVKEIAKIKIKCPTDDKDCLSCGVVYLPTGDLVVSECSNNKLKLFTDKGEYLDELKLPYSPRDMCQVGNNLVAVIINTPGFIYVVKVESSKLTLCSKIQVPGDACFGITYADGTYVVSTYSTDDGCIIYGITTDGQSDVIHRRRRSKCLHLTYDSVKKNIISSYYSSIDGDTAVTRLKSTEVMDLLKVDMVEVAVGVDVDMDSNVYVCGRGSNNIIQISSDGTRVRELLSSIDGIYKPRAISVCGDRFVVTNQSDDHRNCIHLFHLIYNR